MPLIDLIKDGWLKTPAIIKAFQKINRADFLPDDMKDMAEVNEALPIGFGQTISQPLVVAFMMELLQPNPGDKILDVGSGSGWTSALLGEMVGENGRVIAAEVIPELKEFGEKNVAKYGFIEKGIVKFVCADGSKGYEEEAPYDKILASASAARFPEEWKTQLKPGGRIVAPLGDSIWLMVKKDEPVGGKDLGFDMTEYPGFVFVPLINKD